MTEPAPGTPPAASPSPPVPDQAALDGARAYRDAPRAQKAQIARQLHQAGHSRPEIGAALGAGRETVRQYLLPDEEYGALLEKERQKRAPTPPMPQEPGVPPLLAAKGVIRLKGGKLVAGKPPVIRVQPPNRALPSRAEFAAAADVLTADLVKAGKDGAAALIGPDADLPCGEWGRQRATRAEAARLLGIARASMIGYMDRPRAHFPPEGADRRWAARDLLIWQAASKSRVMRLSLHRWPERDTHYPAARDAHGRGLSARAWAQESESTGHPVGRNLAQKVYAELGFTGEGPQTAGNRTLLPMIRKLRASGQPVRTRDVLEHVHAAGYALHHTRARELLTKAGGPVLGVVQPDVPTGCGGIKGRPCPGLIRAVTVARASGCTPQAISAAVTTGRLTPWARDRRGLLYDLCRMKAAPTGTAVDADWKRGKAGERWVKAGEDEQLAAAVRVLLGQAGDTVVTVPQVVACLRDRLDVEVPEKRAAVLLARA